MVQRWDASADRWNLISDWIQSDRELVGRLAAEDAAAYAAENNIQPACN